MKKTLKQIITDLEDFQKDHDQLKYFGFGDLWQMSTSDISYGLMWVTPAISNNDGRQMNVILQIGILDRLLEDNSNLRDVLSDTLLIANDVIAWFQDDEEQYGYVANETGISLEPFVQKFDDNVAGWFFELEFQVPNKLNTCEVPE